MIFRDQTRLTGSNGDCFVTCIECILELPTNYLPKPTPKDMVDQKSWEYYYCFVKEKLQQINIVPVTMRLLDANDKEVYPEGISLATYEHKPTGRGHSVVMWCDKVIHDPHPTTRMNPEDLGKLIDYTIFVPIDPSRMSGRFAIKIPKSQPS